MQAATPSLPLAPVPIGQSTDLSEPGPLSHAFEYADRNAVKFFVVPDSSERWQTVMFELGRFAPLLSLAIAGSLQVFTLPRKMSARVAPSSLRPLATPLTL